LEKESIVKESTMQTQKKDFRIVFMGTPEFSVGILEELLQQEFRIVGVVTTADKQSGRGLQVNESAVKKYASEKCIPILQPTNLKDTTFLAELRALQADLFVVVAFRMLPEVVWSMPAKGTINLHASLLPNYRGAAPINWAIMNGEKETGVTTFFIEKEIDTGKVIERATLQIEAHETAGTLHDKLMHLGASVCASTVEKIRTNKAEAIDQLQLTDGEEKNAPKIFKPDCTINWNASVNIIDPFIRGLSPYPGASTMFHNIPKNEKKLFKISQCYPTLIPVDPHKHFFHDKEGIYIACSDYYLRVTELQMEGKRKMDFKSFLAGNSLEEWKKM
jgi:methionyl-tRNA formyltransferase